MLERVNITDRTNKPSKYVRTFSNVVKNLMGSKKLRNPHCRGEATVICNTVLCISLENKWILCSKQAHVKRVWHTLTAFSRP